VHPDRQGAAVTLGGRRGLVGRGRGVLGLCGVATAGGQGQRGAERQRDQGDAASHRMSPNGSCHRPNPRISAAIGPDGGDANRGFAVLQLVTVTFRQRFRRTARRWCVPHEEVMMSSTLPHVRTRLKDLADQAGVSTATVSRVLNGKPGVAAETRKAVLAALDVLGYDRPEKLRNRSQGLVGLIVPELDNPVFPALAQAIETTLSDRGYTPLLCTQSPGGTTEDEYIEMLIEHGVDGIVFVSGRHADTTASTERYHRLRGRGLPIVFVNGYAAGVDAPAVSTDDAVAVTLAVRHLRSLGHERIGLAVGPDRYVPSRRKIATFTVLLAEQRPDEDAEQHVVSTLFTVEGGQVAGGELIDSGHTAVVCGSDLMALGVIRAARSRGL